MNQEFILNSSPSVARQLVRLADNSNTIISDNIRTLAKTNLLTDEDFSFLPIALTAQQKSTIQQIVDYNHRAIVLTSEINTAREAVLLNAMMFNKFPLVICSQVLGEWTLLCRKLGLNTKQKDKVILVKPNQLIEDEIISTRRDGLLVLDPLEDENYDKFVWKLKKIQGATREFPQTILLCVINNVEIKALKLAKIACHILTLFPDAPEDILNPTPEKCNSVQNTLSCKGFKNTSPEDFYFMFNTITTLLDQKKY